VAEPELSVVIVNYNTRDLLALCLASLQDHAPAVPYEIIVVDNASSDESSRMIQEDFPSVKCLASDTNLGFAAGHNRGVAQASGRVLLLLNPDTRVEEGVLDTLLAFLREHQDVGVLGCRQIDERSWPQLCYGRDPTMLTEWQRRNDTLGLARGNERVRNRVDGRYSGPSDVDWLTGACMMMRRQVYTRLGGMDEGYWLYFEDADLCRRVRRTGLRVVYHPGVSIFHYRGAAMQKFRPVSSVAYRAAQLRYVRIHRGMLPAAFVRLLLLIRGGLLRLRGGSGGRAWVGRQFIRLALLGAPEPDWRQGPRVVDSTEEVR
jgi:GT2 family glycosyltransferase